MATQSSILDLIFRTKRTGDEAKQVKAELDDLNRVNKQAGQLAQQASLGWLAIKGAVLSAGMAALAAVPGLVQLGIDVKRSETALTAYTGSAENAADAIRQVQDAADGAISKLDASQNATRLFAMGLANTSEEAAKLTEIAVTLGATMGKGPQQALEEFTLMLANQSILRLDTFGISGAKVRQRMVELQQETRGLTRDMAFMMAVMEEGEGRLTALDEAGFQAASSIDRLRAMIEDAKIAIGTWLADGIVPAVDGAMNLKDAVSDQRDEIARTSKSYEEYKRRMNEMALAAVKAGRDSYQGWNPLLNMVGEMGGSLSAYEFAWGKVSEAEWEAMQTAQETTKELSAQEQAAMQAANQVQAFADALAGSELSMEVVKSALNGKLGPAWTAYIDLQEEARQAQVDNAIALGQLEKGTEEYDQAVQDGISTTASYNEKLAEMEENLKKTTAQLIFQHAAQGLNAEATLALGRALGLVDEKTYAIAVGTERLRQLYDAQDGALDGVIANTDNYVRAVGEFNSQVQQLPEEHITEVKVNEMAAQLAIDEVQQNLSEIPPSTNTDVQMATVEAMDNLTRVLGIIFQIPNEKMTRVNADTWWAETNVRNLQYWMGQVKDKTVFVDVRTRNPGGIGGFQHGGQFEVEGPPGPDKVPVSFMATRGETVTISPPRMPVPSSPAGSSGSGGLVARDIIINSGMDIDRFVNELRRRM